MHCYFLAVEYEEFNILRFVEVRSKQESGKIKDPNNRTTQSTAIELQMKDLCGAEGIDRCHCMYDNGTFSRGPFIYEEDPLNVALLYQTCNPDFCYCRGSPDVERDSRNVEMKAIMDLCPRNEMSRCLCEDNSVIKFPFDMTTLFQVCRPKRVRAMTVC